MTEVASWRVQRILDRAAICERWRLSWADTGEMTLLEHRVLLTQLDRERAAREQEEAAAVRAVRPRLI